MKKLTFIFAAIFLLFSCGSISKISTVLPAPPLPIDQQVEVMNSNQNLPDGVKLLASIKIGDSGFSVNCNYETALNLAKQEARKSGGNILYINKHKKPSFWSTCHRIEADVYYKK